MPPWEKITDGYDSRKKKKAPQFRRSRKALFMKLSSRRIGHWKESACSLNAIELRASRGQDTRRASQENVLAPAFANQTDAENMNFGHRKLMPPQRGSPVSANEISQTEHVVQNSNTHG